MCWSTLSWIVSALVYMLLDVDLLVDTFLVSLNKCLVTESTLDNGNEEFGMTNIL